VLSDVDLPLSDAALPGVFTRDDGLEPFRATLPALAPFVPTVLPFEEVERLPTWARPCEPLDVERKPMWMRLVKVLFSYKVQTVPVQR
tara:strand:+ start:385 stop:648 length:264 start_codon:yes stop_codon:yes gene_type:complete